VTESQDPKHADRAKLAQTDLKSVPRDTEPHGGDEETEAARTLPLPADQAAEEPMENRVTLDYVPPKEDRRARHAFADRRKLPAVPGYEVLAELGRGAMGVVYRARQTRLKRVVALKMILAGSHAGTSQLARFQTEAEAVAQLQHPNIVQIFEVGKHEGLPYFSLELVDGLSLREKLADKPLESAEAARLVEVLARAMHHAHQQGIVHRDLKPANVLLTADGLPKISDFGLAKRLEDDSGQTGTGTILGTPSYMAPEQARGAGNEIGPLADVYALGAILYEMLTGRPPFVTANPVDTVMQVLNEEPVAPRRLQPKVNRDLETICLKCLEKDPPKRYADAQALAEDLRRFRRGEPIQARPVGAAERVWRWCRCNPRIAVPSLAAGLLALALMIGGPVAAMVIYEQKGIAEEAQRKAEADQRRANQAKKEAVDAKDEAQRNEREAIHARGVAAKQGQLALDTLKILIREVQTQLENRPQLQGMRRRLLRTALDGLDQVATSGVDERTRDATMAGAYRRMGDVYLELGQSEKSLEHYQVYRAILEELDAEGKLPDPQGNLAFCYGNVGEAARRAGEPSLAREYFLRALEIRRERVQSEPGNKQFQQELAESLGKLGNVSLLMGQIEKARDFYLEAFELRKGWLEAEPDSARARQELAGAHHAMGTVSLRLGALDDAESYSQKALDMMRQLHEGQPQSTTYRWNMALFHNQLGAVRLMADKAPQAAKDYAQSLEVLETLSADDPQNALLRRHLSETHYGLATALGRLQDPAAADHYESALRLRQQLVEVDPNSAAEQTGLMLCLGRCGAHQEAAKIADRLRKSYLDESHILYSVAAGYAVCAEAVGRDEEAADAQRAQLVEQYGRLAVETLRSAIEHGYEVTAELTLDPDLDGIRDRADFQDLLKGRETPPAASSAAASTWRPD
jgi:tetratricopeptide (TPR) repeat protein